MRQALVAAVVPHCGVRAERAAAVVLLPIRDSVEQIPRDPDVDEHAGRVPGEGFGAVYTAVLNDGVARFHSRRGTTRTVPPRLPRRVFLGALEP